MPLFEEKKSVGLATAFLVRKFVGRALVSFDFVRYFEGAPTANAEGKRTICSRVALILLVTCNED